MGEERTAEHAFTSRLEVYLIAKRYLHEHLLGQHDQAEHGRGKGAGFGRKKKSANPGFVDPRVGGEVGDPRNLNFPFVSKLTTKSATTSAVMSKPKRKRTKRMKQLALAFEHFRGNGSLREHLPGQHDQQDHAPGAYLKSRVANKVSGTDKFVEKHVLKPRLKKTKESIDLQKLAERQVGVRAFVRRSRGGKVVQVSAHSRTIAKVNRISKGKRQFRGVPVNTKTKLSKSDLGRVGEAITIKAFGGVETKDFLGEKRNNLAFDVINVKSGTLFEVKAGAISNAPDAQKWRLTKGEPSRREKDFLKRSSPAIKRLYNSGKENRILARKLAMKKEIERLTGKTFKVKTITYVVNPDTKTADQFEFKGLHPVIRWNWPMAKKGYRRSIKWD